MIVRPTSSYCPALLTGLSQVSLSGEHGAILILYYIWESAFAFFDAPAAAAMTMLVLAVLALLAALQFFVIDRRTHYR